MNPFAKNLLKKTVPVVLAAGAAGAAAADQPATQPATQPAEHKDVAQTGQSSVAQANMPLVIPDGTSGPVAPIRPRFRDDFGDDMISDGIRM